MADAVKLIEMLGGEQGIRDWVNGFYDLVEADALLAPLFPADMKRSREKQWAYFVEFFGGAAHYTSTYGKPFLRFLHRKVKIGQEERDQWLRLTMVSLQEQGVPPVVVEAVQARLATLASAMINHHPNIKDAYYFN